MTYKEAITEAASEILKTVMDMIADPEGGIGIDQVEALMDGHIGPIVQADLDAARAKALRDAAALAQSECGPYHSFFADKILALIPQSQVSEPASPSQNEKGN
jgi:hypothetical protein